MEEVTPQCVTSSNRKKVLQIKYGVFQQDLKKSLTARTKVRKVEFNKMVCNDYKVTTRTAKLRG